MTIEDMEKNITQIYLSASEKEYADGLVWYNVANTFAQGLADKFDITLWQAAGIIAALSPQISWEKNMPLAERLCENPNKNPGCLGKNAAKASMIFYGESPTSVLGGLKVNNFCENIMLRDGETIDRHATNIAYGKIVPEKVLQRKGEYERIAQAYRNVADRLGIRSYQLQAITWLTWRNRLNAQGKRGIRK